jgi:CspA family cold shock protein
VTAFDDAAGLGTVASSEGTAYRFHCVEITDGSRHIDAGTSVTFRLLPKLGRVEAGAVTPVGV